MKKFLILSFTLFCAILSFAQVKELNGKYFINKVDFNAGYGKITIQEYVNYDSYLKYWEARKNHNWLGMDYERKAMEVADFKPKKGQYFLNNPEENQKFWFTTDQNGLFQGKGKAELKDYSDKINHYTFTFKDGIAIETEVRDENKKLTKRYTRNNEIFVMESFAKSGKTDGKIEYHGDTDNYKNSIRTDYYDNGNIKMIDDYIADTTKKFSEDGKPVSFINHITGDEIIYDGQGKKQRHSYTKGDTKFLEYYKNGVLYQQDRKDLKTKREVQENYENGKLTSYTVTENGRMKSYNAEGKLITESPVYMIAPAKSTK